MLNNAWPEMIWHLYDYYFNQGGSYFATKKACESIHIQYNYNTRSINIVNSMYTVIPPPLIATAQVFSVAGTKLYDRSVNVNSPIPSDGVVKGILVLPGSIPGTGPTYFVHLALANSTGVVSRNTYWLSSSADVLDYSKSTFYNTPCTSFADFTLLEQLPPVTLSTTMNVATKDPKIIATVAVQNPTKSIAFFIRLRIVKLSDGMDVFACYLVRQYVLFNAT